MIWICSSLQPQAALFCAGRDSNVKSVLLLLLLLRGGLLKRSGKSSRCVGFTMPAVLEIFELPLTFSCGLIFMIFIFCLVWFISTRTHSKERTRNKHICQRKRSHKQGWLSEQLGTLENKGSSLANYLSACNSRGFTESLSEQAGGKEDKKKKKRNIPRLFLFAPDVEKQNELPSSGWGSALPWGSSNKSVCACVLWGHSACFLLPSSLTSHTHSSTHPAVNEVTGQFALLPLTWA